MKTQISRPSTVLCLVLGGLAMSAGAVPAADGVTAPNIVPRAAWSAKPADTTLMQPQTPREIVIHHTGEKRRPELTLREKLQKLQAFSQSAGLVGTTPKPPWGDVPYHFYVDAAGRIGEGRNLGFAGDSNTPYDTAHRIQIVVEGNFDQEQPAPVQLAALDRLVLWLSARYNVPAAQISGHADHVSNTACPGQGLKTHLPILRAKAAKTSRSSRRPRADLSFPRITKE